MYEEVERDLRNWSKAWGDEPNPVGPVPVKLLAAAADAIHQLSHHADDWEKIADYWRKEYEELERQIQSVTPIKHGKWLVKIDPWDRQHIGKCSECGRTNCNYEYYRFCPQCGAKMDGDEK